MTPNQRAIAAAEIAMALPRLIRMAQANGLDLLAFMLDQARVAAESEATGPRKPALGAKPPGRPA